MQKVIGVIRKKGNYQGVDYDNYKLFIATEIINGGELVGGANVIFENVSAKTLESLNIEPKSLVNQNITFAYNKFGKIAELTILK